MPALAERVAPGATDLVRRDHQALLTLFHRWSPKASARRRRALALSAALALEVHAQVEEEILYTALREVGPSEFLLGAVDDHSRMRALIARLRQQPAGGANVGDEADVFMELMREVMHHMAEEETRFLPEVERVLQGRLGELGAQMLQRRLALMAPRLPALAWHRLRASRTRSWWWVAALAVGGLMAARPRHPRLA